MSARVPPWTRTAVREWPDERPVVLVECSRGHPIAMTVGDVRRAA